MFRSSAKFQIKGKYISHPTYNLSSKSKEESSITSTPTLKLVSEIEKKQDAASSYSIMLRDCITFIENKWDYLPQVMEQFNQTILKLFTIDRFPKKQTLLQGVQYNKSIFNGYNIYPIAQPTIKNKIAAIKSTATFNLESVTPSISLITPISVTEPKDNDAEIISTLLDEMVATVVAAEPKDNDTKIISTLLKEMVATVVAAAPQDNNEKIVSTLLADREVVNGSTLGKVSNTDFQVSSTAKPISPHFVMLTIGSSLLIASLAVAIIGSCSLIGLPLGLTILGAGLLTGVGAGSTVVSSALVYRGMFAAPSSNLTDNKIVPAVAISL